MQPDRTPTRTVIATLTMNPALDITTSTDVVHSADKIRCAAARYDAGGGGINVSRVANVLGVPTSAVFPVGGSTGGQVEKLLAEAGAPSRVIPIVDSTRESFTINERTTDKQYRFVLPGPQITSSERAQCLDELRAAAASAESGVAGSNRDAADAGHRRSRAQ